MISLKQIFKENFTGFFCVIASYLLFVFFARQNSPLSWLPPVIIVSLFYYRWCFSEKKITNISFLFISGILFRLLFLFYTPALSEDYARFIWDGKINLTQNISVFESTPYEIMSTGQREMQSERSLYSKLNSRNYFSVYPPASQVVFTFSVLMGGSVKGVLVVMRLLIWLTEIALFFLLIRWMRKEKTEISAVGKYFLNPLIIIEWSGSLHYEGIMITFFIAALWYARKTNWFLSVICWFAAVATKLLPLLFIPVLWKRVSFLKTTVFAIAVIALLVLSFLPFLSFEQDGFLSSLNLYFQRFEFNGSLYILLREFITLFTGFNPNEFLVPALIICCLSLFVILFFKQRKNGWQELTGLILLLWLLWFFFAPVVHPWYLTSLVVLSCITGKKTSLVWSLLIFLSYFLYWNNSWWMAASVVVLQYLPVYFVFLREYFPNPDNQFSPGRT